MRVGEALALDDPDVDLEQSIITVRRAKFGKSRLLPVHPTTTAALHHYIRRRDRLCPHRPTPSFFVSSTGRRVLHQNFHHVFLRLISQGDIRGPAGRRARLHDLRHTFAVKTVGDWYRAGVDVEARLPWLSTYLGHVSPSSTYWYLSATPELLDAAGARLERFWEAEP
jgi:integrase